MRIYVDQSSKAAGQVRRHTLHVAPAADCAGKECPPEWVDADNKPLTFTMEFIHGSFDNLQTGIPDSVLKYAVDKKLAQKSRPLMRVLADALV